MHIIPFFKSINFHFNERETLYASCVWMGSLWKADLSGYSILKKKTCAREVVPGFPESAEWHT